MKGFPMSVDLYGKLVFLVGKGPQIRDKAEKLAPFGPRLIYKDAFTVSDAQEDPAMVIVGDTPLREAEEICRLCRQYRIPVNVVDVPRLCSFYFPALINRGDLTVSVATGGGSPELAGELRRRIEATIPDNMDQILDWVARNRAELRAKKILKPAVGAALEKGRPLTQQELQLLAEKNNP